MWKLRILIPFAIGIQALVAQSPVVKMAAPKYPPFTGPTVEVPVEVKIIVEADGTPFSIEAESGIPHEAVLAIRESEFRRQNTPYRVAVALMIPRLLETFRPSRFDAAPEEADKLTSQSAAELETKLKSNKESVADRQQLLRHAAHEDGARGNELRFRQLSWLVKNQPTSGFWLSGGLSRINARSGQGADLTAYAQVKALWTDAMAKAPDDVGVKVGAARYMMIENPAEAEALLLPRFASTTRAAPLLGELYALASLGVTGIDLITGEPSEFDSQRAASDFAAKSRDILSRNANIRLLKGAAETITRARWGLAKSGRVSPDFKEVCESVRDRIRATFPDYSPSCEIPQNVPVQDRAVVTQGLRKKFVQPTYPDEAKRRHIEGEVRLQATIGKDGTIKNVELSEGALALYDAAREAVRQWEYKPYFLGREPVEVATEITVRYNLN